MKKYFLIIPLIIHFHAFAQHDMPGMPNKKDTIPPKHEDTIMHTKHNMMMMDSGMIMPPKDTPVSSGVELTGKIVDFAIMNGMNHSFSLSLPMSRNGSGTSWMPDNSPMQMLMIMGKGMWMFHGSIFLRYNNQQLTNNTSRSAVKFDAPNWLMAMYTRQFGKNGLFHFSSMLSADALTVGANGYPLLFQSGESYNGKPLVDRQHPHDFFSELSVAYTQRINNKTDVYAYFGYPGEPALGPPAFMHRESAMNIPDAPISHHWQDATHITFGVATVGIRLDKMKIEFSKFTGREPDENRYNFDAMKFDSYAYRFSYNPNKSWALQFSQGYIKSPEALNPAENIWRYTASALYTTHINKGKYFQQVRLIFYWAHNLV